MEIYNILLSLFTGCGLGVLYGFFFLLHSKKRILIPDQSSENPEVTKRHYRLSLVFALLRIVTLAALWYFLLRSPSFNFILVLVSFLAAFWLVILNDKAKKNGRINSPDR